MKELSMGGSAVQTSLLLRHYPEMGFGGFTDIDGTIAFYLRVRALAEAATLIVDVGCGRGAHATDPVATRVELRNLRGPTRTVVGIDVDESARRNPTIDEFRPIRGGRWPLEDA